MKDSTNLSNFYAMQVYNFFMKDLKGVRSAVKIPCNLEIDSGIVETVSDIYHRDN